MQNKTKIAKKVIEIWNIDHQFAKSKKYSHQMQENVANT